MLCCHGINMCFYRNCWSICVLCEVSLIWSSSSSRQPDNKSETFVDEMIWFGLWLHLTMDNLKQKHWLVIWSATKPCDSGLFPITSGNTLYLPSIWLKERVHNKYSTFACQSSGWQTERQVSNHCWGYLLLHFKSCCEEPLVQIWDQTQLAIPNPAVCVCVCVFLHWYARTCK